MRPRTTLPLLLLALPLLAGCGNGEPVRGKIDRVQRVFMHEPGDYSVMWNDGGRLTTQRFQLSSRNVNILTDVKDDGPLWVEYYGSRQKGQSTIGYSEVNIHLRGVEDINPAGTAAGKNKTSGLTQTVAEDAAKNGRHLVMEIAKD